MTAPSHLRSLQALELAIREGTLKDAAARLGITPAAVGQRIRALEDYLGTDLLVRGRSGLHPTREVDAALGDLRVAFEALERVMDTLDFQRVTEIHVVADPDWAELWLEPRLATFRTEHPNIRFCVNGEGDMPTRLGAPDVRVEHAGSDKGEVLFTDQLLPVCSPDLLHRIADYDSENEMEGLPLLHLTAQRDRDDHPGWHAWFEHFGFRKTGTERGIHYGNARLAIEAARQAVGFAICGYSLLEPDLISGELLLPYPIEQSIPDLMSYRLRVRDGAEARPQIARFASWLRSEARNTESKIDIELRRPALRPEPPR